jgi:hypothetical protein
MANHLGFPPSTLNKITDDAEFKCGAQAKGRKCMKQQMHFIFSFII